MVAVVTTQELKAGDVLWRFKAEAAQDELRRGNNTNRYHRSSRARCVKIVTAHGILLTYVLVLFFFSLVHVCVCVCVCVCVTLCAAFCVCGYVMICTVFLFVLYLVHGNSTCLPINWLSELALVQC